MKELFNLRTLFQSMKKSKLFTAINLIGFSISLTLVILLGAYTYHELNVDRFQENHERIWIFAGNVAYTPPALAPEVKKIYPAVDRYTRLFSLQMVLDHEGNKYRSKILSSDPTFFSIFSFGLIDGDPKSVMQGAINEVVISETYARKVFGDKSPIGKSLVYAIPDSDESGQPESGSYSFIVSGVMSEMTHTFLKRADVIANIAYLGQIRGAWLSEGWDSGNHLSVFLMKDDTDPNSYHDELLRTFRDIYWIFKDNPQEDFEFVPLNQAYLDGGISRHQVSGGGNNGKYISLMGIAALLVLIFAIINYVNLMTAQNTTRARELATRRLLGSSRGMLFCRLILESTLLCMLSFGIALGLSLLFAQPFSELLNLTDPLFEGIGTGVWLSAILGILLIGIISGLFPAWIITNFTPLDVVKGTFLRKTRQIYGRILIGFQYTVTLVLLISASVILAQTRFLRSMDTGFDKRNLIYVNHEEGVNPDRVCKEFRRIPGISNLSKLSGSVLDRGNNLTFKGKNGNLISTQQFVADTAVFDVMKYTIDRTFLSDTTLKTGVWLNDRYYKSLDLADHEHSFTLYTGTKWEQNIQINGIIHDFLFTDQWDQLIQLTVVSDVKDPMGYMIRYEGGDPIELMAELKNTYEQITGGFPFSGRFVDVEMDAWYNEQERAGSLILLISLIAILIATMGILAMSSYSIRQRENEVAVRKVYGSSEKEVVYELVRYFLGLLSLAFLAALPIAWFLMKEWLSSYSRSIALSPLYFIGPFILILIIALLIVVRMSWKAAIINPIQALKR